MKVTVEHNIPDSRIEDLLCSAFEGGSDYWIEGVKYIYPEGKSKKDFTFPHIELPLKGDSIIVTDVESGKRTLDREAVERGLKVLARKYPKHMVDILNEDDDACTADLFLQCCLFGEEVYG